MDVRPVYYNTVILNARTCWEAIVYLCAPLVFRWLFNQNGMYDICGIGHITLDKVITPQSIKYMPGGTSYYFSNAIRNMQLNYLLVTLLGESEMHTVASLRELGININAYPSLHSVYFENNYSANLNQRTQRVLQKANPFSVDQLQGVKAKIFHLGPLLADDMSAAFIKELSASGRISLDVQGFLRTVHNEHVVLSDWAWKQEVLQYISILKADDRELEMLTGCKEPREGALKLFEWGIQEVVITFGNRGSLIYTEGVFHRIPAFIPNHEVDTTGCGDTYMAGYLSQRILGQAPDTAGIFAAAMAALKTETYGPFTGTPEDVYYFMSKQAMHPVSF